MLGFARASPPAHRSPVFPALFSARMVVRADGGFIGSSTNLVRGRAAPLTLSASCLRVGARSAVPACQHGPCTKAGRAAQIMVASTGLILAAGRFGLAPSANRLANAGLKLSEKNQGQLSGDPAGFTASDVLYGGSVGHSASPPPQKHAMQLAPRAV